MKCRYKHPEWFQCEFYDGSNEKDVQSFLIKRGYSKLTKERLKSNVNCWVVFEKCEDDYGNYSHFITWYSDENFKRTFDYEQ